MKYDELVKMGVVDLKARLKSLSTQAQTQSGAELEASLEEAKTINDILKDIQNRAQLNGMALDAAVADKGNVSDNANGEADNVQDKAKEDRGISLKAGKAVNYNAKGTLGAKNVLKTGKTNGVLLPNHQGTELTPGFNTVSSLIDRVKVVPLAGGETYERGYVKGYGTEGGATAEGAEYKATEPVFGYVSITKQKVTAYTEEPEEMLRLPAADYDGVVEEAITKAIRRYMTRQILLGNGTAGNFYGIFANPENAVIDKSTDIAMTAITDETLDDIVYDFGGDEDVEDVAVLILNKKDLKAMAKLRDQDGRKTYTIVNHGNTGTIDGVPYIINSACKAITDPGTMSEAYSMAYGPLANYELAIFSDIEAKKSEDFKFKTGQICYRASVFAGGAPIAYNGFIRVKKK